MPTYTEISRPPAPTYSERGKALNRLLINTTDFLLINSSGDRLGISDRGLDLYTEIARPSTTYTEITKPV